MRSDLQRKTSASFQMIWKSKHNTPRPTVKSQMCSLELGLIFASRNIRYGAKAKDRHSSCTGGTIGKLATFAVGIAHLIAVFAR